MILQKCPRCQRDQLIDAQDKQGRYRCSNCGNKWEEGPVTRRVVGPRQASPGQRPLRAVDTPSQVRKVMNDPVHRYDTPSSRKGSSDTRYPKISGYEELELIGKGGMGEVYRAKQKSLGRKVAIKVLDKGLARNDASKIRFRKEAATMAQMHHPNIVYVIDRGKERGAHYFVMEYVEGPSLRAKIKACPTFPIDEGLETMLCLAKTMAYAHNEGVVHRDLKPENILFDSNNLLKVADFGLVGVERETTHIKKLTRSYVSMGTECYMAPEQKKDAKNVDHRADIYSMGVMLYELLTGEIPFPNVPPPEKAIVPGRPDIDAIIRCALAFERKNRYGTTDAFVLALEKAIEFGYEAQTATMEDTIVDTPAVEDYEAGNRWAYINDKRGETEYRQGTLALRNHKRRQVMFVSIILAVIAGLTALFFIFGPRPKSSQTIHKSDAWKFAPPVIEKTQDHDSVLGFDFSRLPKSKGFGHSRLWSDKGYMSNGNVLERNTYRSEFVDEKRLKWASYTGHKFTALSSLKASVLFKDREPFLDKYRGLISQTPKLPIVGIGLKENGKKAVTLLLRKDKVGLSYRFMIHSRKLLPIKKKVRDEKLAVYKKWLPLNLKKRFAWGDWINLEIKVTEREFSAVIQNKRVAGRKLVVDYSSLPEFRVGLVARSGYVGFRDVQARGKVAPM